MFLIQHIFLRRYFLTNSSVIIVLIYKKFQLKVLSLAKLRLGLQPAAELTRITFCFNFIFTFYLLTSDAVLLIFLSL